MRRGYLDRISFKSSLFIYLVFGLLLVTILFLSKDTSFQNRVDILTVATLLLLITQLIIMKINHSASSFLAIFLFLSYFFHFGHLILVSSPFVAMGYGTYVLFVVGETVFLEAITFSILFMYMFYWGCLFVFRKRAKLVNPKTSNCDINESLLKNTGLFLFFSGLPFFSNDIICKDIYLFRWKLS